MTFGWTPIDSPAETMEELLFLSFRILLVSIISLSFLKNVLLAALFAG